MPQMRRVITRRPRRNCDEKKLEKAESFTAVPATPNAITPLGKSSEKNPEMEA